MSDVGRMMSWFVIVLFAGSTVGGLLLGTRFGKAASAPQMGVTALLLGALPALAAAATRVTAAGVHGIVGLAVLCAILPTGFAVVNSWARAHLAIAPAGGALIPPLLGVLWCAAASFALLRTIGRTPVSPSSSLLVRARGQIPSVTGMGAAIVTAILLSPVTHPLLSIASAVLVGTGFHGLSSSLVLRALRRRHVSPDVPFTSALARAAALTSSPEPVFANMVCLSRQDSTDAFAEVWRPFGGRATLVVSQALIELLTEEQMAAIVVHEFAHVVFANHRTRLTAAVVMSIVLGGATVTVVLGLAPESRLSALLLGGVAATLFRRWFMFGLARQQEHEADDYTVAAGLGRALASALRVVAANRPGGEFSTHPTTDERIGHLDGAPRS